jgi:hypothetical protein
MRILAIISGEYGERHVSNIKKHCPKNWVIEVWRAPNIFPLIIDYPEDFLPESLQETDLILSFGEHRRIAALPPDGLQITGAKAGIAALDTEAWLPRGLARQLRGWLDDMNVACVTPKPLCSLTEKDYLTSRFKRIGYNNNNIAEFSRLFGQPEIKLEIDPQLKVIKSANVQRDAVCGCARHVANGLAGISVEMAEEKAGLLHHHYPCLASMGKDVDFDDTLMHISGNLLKDNIGTQVKPFKEVDYISPGKRSD